jgi:(E)-4-hydroxy-3-methyl-but-2-enyl pyrophosphate reductase
VQADAERRGLKVFDATCPLVTKVHVEVAKMLRDGYEIVMIGHRGHPESEGTMGQAVTGMHLVETVEDVAALKPATDRLAYVTQTTLSVDDAAQIVAALQRALPGIRGPKKDDICYATQNRQDAVKFMAPQCDVVIVVGSPNSSNSNRLREVARTWACRRTWSTAPRTCGRMDRRQAPRRHHRGASAPEVLVEELIARLKSARREERAPARRHLRERGVHAAARARAARLAYWGLFANGRGSPKRTPSGDLALHRRSRPCNPGGSAPRGRPRPRLPRTRPRLGLGDVDRVHQAALVDVQPQLQAPGLGRPSGKRGSISLQRSRALAELEVRGE